MPLTNGPDPAIFANDLQDAKKDRVHVKGSHKTVGIKVFLTIFT